jgi:flagellar biosynthesis protein FlhG
MAMARLGHRVGILDADFALGNIDVMLGLTPHQHLGAVLDGLTAIGEVTLEGPHGVRIIPAGSGVRSLTSLDDAKWSRLVAAIEEAGRDLDFLFFDTATGIGDTVLDVIGLADHVIVVTSYEPAAVVDAYAVIKLVTANDASKTIGVVVNSARDAEEGGVVFRQISLAADRFLGRSLRYEGHVLEDRLVKESGFAQMPFVGGEQAGPASTCIRRLASKLTNARQGGGPWPAKPVLVAPLSASSGSGSLEAPRCA